MTGCDIHRQRLSAHLDGELPANERAEVDAHLAACAACRTLAGQLAEADRAWTGVPEPAWRADSTDALVGRLKAELAREAPATPPAHVIAVAQGWGPWRSLAFGVAGILALAVFPAAFSLTKSSSRSDEMQARVPAASAVAPAPAAAPAEKDAGADRFARAAAPSRSRGRARAREDQDETAVAAPAVGKIEAKAKDRPVEIANARTASRAEPAPQTSQLAAPAAQAAPAAPPVAASPMSMAAARTGPPAEPALEGASSGKAAGAGADPLRADLAALEARIQAIEAEVARFTVAAREQAVQSSQLVSTRRYVPWR